MIVFDHNDARWRSRYRRTNGAETYSKDIVRYQLSNWQGVLGPHDAISTCPRLSNVNLKGSEYGTVIQYLHSYPYQNALARVERIRSSVRCRRLIFITAYKAFAKLINVRGFEARFVPMAIDVSEVRRHKTSQNEIENAVLWFGNISNKATVFESARLACRRSRLKLHVWANGEFNGNPVTQAEGWQMASRYAYGIAVGRCALELYALGLKVIIAGRKVGGLAMNARDAELQTATNFNGRVTTFSNNMITCLREVERSAVVEPLDISQMDHASPSGSA